MGPEVGLVLRVSSLVRFYKSRFWFVSENFLKNFWIKFLKNFWKICESRDFLLPAIQKWMKAGCFAAVFKLFCCYFQTFCVAFLEFWRISEIFQKFFRFFSEISEKILKIFWKICESRDFLLPAIQKWMKTSCFAAIFKLFALLFSNFDEFQKFFRNSSQKYFRNILEINQIYPVPQQAGQKVSSRVPKPKDWAPLGLHWAYMGLPWKIRQRGGTGLKWSAVQVQADLLTHRILGFVVLVACPAWGIPKVGVAADLNIWKWAEVFQIRLSRAFYLIQNQPMPYPFFHLTPQGLGVCAVCASRIMARESATYSSAATWWGSGGQGSIRRRPWMLDIGWPVTPLAPWFPSSKPHNISQY